MSDVYHYKILLPLLSYLIFSYLRAKYHLFFCSRQLFSPIKLRFSNSIKRTNSMKLSRSNSDNNPIFLTSWSVEPDIESLTFDLYSTSGESLFKKRRILVTDTEKMEWIGENNQESNCRFESLDLNLLLF